MSAEPVRRVALVMVHRSRCGTGDWLARSIAVLRADPRSAGLPITTMVDEEGVTPSIPYDEYVVSAVVAVPSLAGEHGTTSARFAGMPDDVDLDRPTAWWVERDGAIVEGRPA